MKQISREVLVSRLAVAAVFILSGLYLVVPILGGSNALCWLVAILNLITGPSILFGYINEVRKGFFRSLDEGGEEEDAQDAENASKEDAQDTEDASEGEGPSEDPLKNQEESR